MGHYYDCPKCGEERCRCPQPTRPSFLNRKESIDEHCTSISISSVAIINSQWSTTVDAHTHSVFLLVDGRACPVNVVIDVLDQLSRAIPRGGFIRVIFDLSARNTKIVEPRAAAQVVVDVCRAIGLHYGEGLLLMPLTGTSRPTQLTFIGQRGGAWVTKANELKERLTQLRNLQLKN